MALRRVGGLEAEGEGKEGEKSRVLGCLWGFFCDFFFLNSRSRLLQGLPPVAVRLSAPLGQLLTAGLWARRGVCHPRAPPRRTGAVVALPERGRQSYRVASLGLLQRAGQRERGAAFCGWEWEQLTPELVRAQVMLWGFPSVSSLSAEIRRHRVWLQQNKQPAVRARIAVAQKNTLTSVGRL